MITIYRIQDKDGRGPYKPGWSHYWQEMRCLIDAGDKPTFMDEFPGIVQTIYNIFDKEGGAFGCGFRTMDQLRKWFSPSEIDKLSHFGYQIVKIRADRILAESPLQLVFWCKKPLRRPHE